MTQNRFWAAVRLARWQARKNKQSYYVLADYTICTVNGYCEAIMALPMRIVYAWGSVSREC